MSVAPTRFLGEQSFLLEGELVHQREGMKECQLPEDFQGRGFKGHVKEGMQEPDELVPRSPIRWRQGEVSSIINHLVSIGLGSTCL